ncbi:hypothetical protein UPYG_G00053730 [Umbra pygmaea]|uniref:PiggyBac transposable element-derived protein domain-containing protein n=1 Tax=Umbra pygmaea TaxID=75934 RepID=A0ABD0X7R8_UMBPY
MSSPNSASVKEVDWTEKHFSGQDVVVTDERDRAVKRKRNAFRIKTEKDYVFITVKKEQIFKEENEEFKVNAEDFSVKEEEDKFVEDITVKEEITHFRVKEEEANAQVDEDPTILSSSKKHSPTKALARQPDESWTTCVPADSDSDDEDLLLREDESDSDNIDEDYRIQGPTLASKGDYYSVVNSFLLHKELHKNNPTKSYSLKMFREKLLVEMLYFAKVCEPNTSPQPAPISCMPEYIGDDGTKARKHCKRCLNAGNSKVKTPVHCRKCQVHLCLTSQRNCFRDWHDSM